MEMAAMNENGSSNNNIPDDLFLSILSKLPLKSLKRFTCLRKSWALLFEDPKFMSMYLPNFISDSYDDNSFLLLKKNEPCEFIWISGERFGDKLSLDWLPPPQHHGSGRYFRLLGLGNGISDILCICDSNQPYEDSVFVCNPATGESLIVPPSSFNSNDVSPYFDYLVEHCGFGYDHVGFDYKLIKCVYWVANMNDDELDWDNCPEFPDIIWEIYSVRSNTWRTLDVDLPPRIQTETGSDLYLNGVCHWWGEMRTINNEMFLVSFNLSTEVAVTTPFPPHLNEISICRHLSELNGSIALISYRLEEDASFDISILGEIGVMESWVKLFTFGPLPSFRNLFGVGKNGDIFFIKSDDELACFNLSTQTIEEMGVHIRSFTCQLMIYKESFLPIRGIHN